MDTENEVYDSRKFRDMILAKGGSKSLRELASEIGGVSASTLSRILAKGKDPDFLTYMRIKRWLGIRDGEIL